MRETGQIHVCSRRAKVINIVDVPEGYEVCVRTKSGVYRKLTLGIEVKKGGEICLMRKTERHLIGVVLMPV